MQHPQCQADHLQILAASRSRYIPGFGADIVDDRFLQPRDEEVCAFVDDSLLDSRQTIKDYCPTTAFDIVHGGLGEGTADGEWDGPSVDCSEGVGHGVGLEMGVISRNGRKSCTAGGILRIP